MDTALYSFLGTVAESCMKRTIPLVREDVAALLRALAPRRRGARVLELGTGMGYSACVIAEAMGLVRRVPECPYDFVEPNHPQALQRLESMGNGLPSPGSARIVTIDRDPRRVVEATLLFRSLGVGGDVVAVHGECPGVLAALEGPFDLVFVDAGKSGNREYVEAITDGGLIGVDGVLVVDNLDFAGGGDTARSRRIRENIEVFVEWFRALDGWDSVRLAVGDGVMLGIRQETRERTRNI